MWVGGGILVGLLLKCCVSNTGWSVVEMLCLKLLPQFSSYLNEVGDSCRWVGHDYERNIVYMYHCF